MKRRLEHLSFVLLILVAAGSAAGQTRGYPYNQPGRIARVQYVSGQVSIAPCEGHDWVAAALNQPLRPPICIWADKDSRAELNLGNAFIRMGSETSVSLSTVNRGTFQFRVNQGVVSLSVRYLFPGEIYEIDTPNTTLTLMKAGVYRINVYPDQDQTWVTVRRGSVAATGEGKSVTVNAGQQVRFQNKMSMQHTAEKAPAPDGFDDWVHVRDQRLWGSGPPRFGVFFGYPPPPYGPGGIWIR
ncbi:MAG: FecR domain-containing protein [Candidatus Korobacteraceae bacterium]